MVLSQLVSAFSALIQSVKYGRVLHIQGDEWKRYLKKSTSLGLCYAGLGATGSAREGWRAGKAAFVCCAYDVVTDWRHFDPAARDLLERIMRAMQLKPELQSLAMNLYEKELFNELEEDGLDRGYIALRFTLKMMGCEKACQDVWGDVDEIGRLCQIVDDVLDYEQDIACGDINCLTSVRREDYLKQLITKFGNAETQRLFGNSRSALVIAIERARVKAEGLIKANDVLQGMSSTSSQAFAANVPLTVIDVLKVEPPRT